jgi:hypothetical protein
MSALLSGLYVTLALTVFLLGWRLVLRKDPLIAVGCIIFVSLISWPVVLSGYGWTGMVAGTAGATVITSVCMRTGLLAAAVAAVMMFLYSYFPMTADVSAPYFGTGLVGVLAVIALAGYGAVIALGGRRLFAEDA